MAASYLILTEKHLVVGRFTGPTDAEDIRCLMRQVFSDPLFNRKFCLLMDFTRAVLRIGIAEVSLLCDFIFSAAKGFIGSTAILTSGTVGTALAMLLSKGLGVFVQSAVFSTLDAALDFLGVDLEAIPDF